MSDLNVQNAIKDAIASFEIEGIQITNDMIEDAVKILTGEATEDELAEKYIDSLKRK